MDMTGEESGNLILEEMSTTATTASESSPFSYERLIHTAHLLDFYYTPLLCFLGAMGNCLSVIVFCFNANHRSSSSSYYLSALAISDTGFLINLFVFWLEGMGTGLLATNFGCPFIMYSGQVTCFLSVWLTVAFTVERFFAVCSPLTRPRICTKSKAKKVIFGLTTFALIAFSYVFVIAEVSERIEDDYSDMIHYTKDENSTNEAYQMSNFTLPSLEVIPPPKGVNTSFGESSGCLLNNSGGDRCQGEYLQKGFQTNGETVEFQENLHESMLTNSDTLLMGIGNRFTSESPLQVNISQLANLTQRLLNATPINLDSTNRTSKSINLFCTVSENNKLYWTISIIANYLDTIITLIIPFCLITFFNMRIAICVWKLKEERRDIIALGKINTSSNKSSSTRSGIKNHVNHIMHSGKGDDLKKSVDRIPSTKQGSKWINLGGVSCFRSVTHKRGSIHSSVSSNTSNTRNEEIVYGTPAESRSQSNPNLIKETNYQLNQSSSRIIHDDNPLSYGAASTLKDGKVDDLRQNGDNSSSVDSDSQNQKIRSSYQPRSSILGANLNGVGQKRGENVKKAATFSASETRVTKMLLLVSTVFLVLNLPSHVIRTASFIHSILWSDDLDGSKRFYAVLHISNILLFNTNFAVNFLLYCLSGRKFRKSLWGIAFGKQNKKSGKFIATTRRTTRFESHRRNENETVVFDENIQFVVGKQN